MARTEVTGSQIKDQSVSLTADVTGILPVANGGTGSNTLPLNNVLLGNGTGALQSVAAGTAGNVLTSNGTTWVSAPPTGEVTLSGTQTLSNKTLVSPTIVGQQTFAWPSGSPASNQFLVAYNGGAGSASLVLNSPSSTEPGGANALQIRNDYGGGIYLSSSAVTVNGVPVVTTTGTQTLSNKTLSSPTVSGTLTGPFTFSGDITTTNGSMIRISHPNQATTDDGAIVAGRFGSGLNIVGVQTNAGTGRQVRVWGDLMDSSGQSYQTYNSTATLFNKTISGTYNTFTNIPASATPNASRWVALTAFGNNTASDGAGTWAKIATITPNIGYTSASYIISVTGSATYGDSAILHVSVRNDISPNSPTVSVQVLAASSVFGGGIKADSFKIISGGWATNAELWMKKYAAFGRYGIYELSRTVDNEGAGGWAITYHDGAAWQAATPTGAVNNVTSQGVTAFDVPVVTTTDTQTLSNKTLTAPLLAYSAANGYPWLMGTNNALGLCGLGYLGAANNAGNWSNVAAAGDVVLRSNSSSVVLTALNDSGGIRFATGTTDSEKLRISNAGTLYSYYNTGINLSTYNVAKSVLGNIHIANGAGTDGSTRRQAAITFQGDNANEAQAGIYVLNTNTNGTTMGFATTDNYGTGPQLFMTANVAGTVNFPRQIPTAGGVQLVTLSGTQSLSNKTLGATTFTGKLTLDGGGTGTIQQNWTASMTSLGYSEFLTANNDGGNRASHFINSTSRSGDGGANTYTIRNNGGSLRLVGASAPVVVEGTDLTLNGVSVVTTSGTQSLSNKTMSSPTISTPAISGNYTSSRFDSHRVGWAGDPHQTHYHFDDSNYPVVWAPLNNDWVDLLRLGKMYGLPTYEIYTSGSWVSGGTCPSIIFDGRDAQNIQLTNGSTQTAVRFTWSNDVYFAWQNPAWLVLSIPYTGQDPAITVLAESSTNGSTWTTRSSGTKAFTQSLKHWFRYTDHQGDSYVRITLTVTNSRPLVLSTMELLSNRPDAYIRQYGQFPYEWDNERRVTIGGNANTSGVSVGGPQSLATARTAGVLNIGPPLGTTAAQGIYFGNDVNLYRSGNDTLKTDDNFYAAGNISTPKVVISGSSGNVIYAASAGDAYMTVSDNTATALIGSTGGVPFVGTQSNHTLNFRVNNTNVASLNASGVLTANLNGTSEYTKYGIPNNTDYYLNARVIRNENTVAPLNDGMHIGYANTNGGFTRLYGGGDITNPVIVGSGGAMSVPGTVTFTKSSTTTNSSLFSTGSYATNQGDGRTHFGYNIGSDTYWNYIRGARTQFDGFVYVGTGMTVDGTVTLNGASAVTTTASQSLSNKTLSSPAITGTVAGDWATNGRMYLTAPSTTLTNDYSNSPISIRERGNVGNTQSGDAYAPNINFHWGSTQSQNLWMGANGWLNYGVDRYAGSTMGISGTIRTGTFVGALQGNADSATTAYHIGFGQADGSDGPINMRFIRNNNTTTLRDGMYIGYGNSNGGFTRLYGGGDTTNPVEVRGGGSLVVPGVITSQVATGTAPFTVSSTTQVTNLNAQYVGGAVPNTGTSANTLVQRNANGDTYSRYVHSVYLHAEHAAAYRANDTIFYSSYDDYVRKNTVWGMRASLGITPRIGTTTSTATPAINTDSHDQYNVTALATNITSMTSSLTGSPVDGQRLMVRIKDNGTARTVTWGASFVASGVAPLLATTVANKTHLCSFLYDSAAAKWVAVATDDQGY